MAENGRTEQQSKWMASVRRTLETTTGRTLAEWTGIARACPETAPRARQRWLKDTHGLGQNYAMLVLGELERESGANPRDPARLAGTLWSDPAAAEIARAVQAAIDELPGAITGQRKGFTSWSRAYAFAAARPMRGGGVRLGLAVDPAIAPALTLAQKEGWSERLQSTIFLASPVEVDLPLRHLLRAAWERS